MRIFRIALGVLVGLWGLWQALALGVAVACKAHLITVTPDNRMAPLYEATPWWRFAIWAATAALLVLSGWRLIRGGRALMAYAAAFLLNVAGWWLMKSGPGYDRAFTRAEQQFDYVILGAMLVVGLAIWWLESRPAPAGTART